MEALPPNQILEFNPNQLAEVRKTFGYDDINKLHQDLQIFEDWIKMQHHFVVKEYDKAYLERYLISGKGYLERAKKRLDKICTLRGLMPEYLQDLDVNNEYTKLRKVAYTCILPKPTPAHTRIIYYSIFNPEVADFEHMHFVRTAMMIFEYLYCHDYNTGIEFLVDTRNFTFGIVTKISPILIANTVMIMTEALGLRLSGVHLFSKSKFIDTIAQIIKQGLPKKLKSRLHIHEDNESLFKFLPKETLPEELGGDLGSGKELCDNNFKEFSSPDFIKIIKDRERAVTDESKRLRSQFNEEYSGMPGSFKVLSVD